MSAQHRDQGLSLVELVVALAIFALVAVMGAQALTGMMRMRDALDARAELGADLAEGVSLMRADLASAIPMLFYPPERAAPRSALSYQTDRLAFSMAGRPVLGSTGLQQQTRQRVIWRVENGKLMRQVWTALTPLDTSARTPEVVALDGVEALRLRSFLPDRGWINGLPLTQPSEDSADGDISVAAEVYSSALPHGVEVTIVTRDHGDIPLIEAFQ